MDLPFKEQGYIAKHMVLDEEEIAAIKKKFNALEQSKPGNKFPSQQVNLHLEHEWIFEICKHPKVLDAAKNILGPNVVLFSTCLITKYPVEKQKENFSGHYVGWHQDLEYCGLEKVESNDKPKLITMWLAIDEADEENGAMKFISGSHKSGFFDRVLSHVKGNVLNDNRDMIIPETWHERAFQTVLSPGECSFHDGMLVHGSGPTLSRRRMGFTVQFVPPSVKMIRPSNYEDTIKHTGDFRKPILVCGEDTFGVLDYFM